MLITLSLTIPPCCGEVLDKFSSWRIDKSGKLIVYKCSSQIHLPLRRPLRRSWETLLTCSGWSPGAGGWDKSKPALPQETLQFIQDTQPKVWEHLEKVLGVVAMPRCWRTWLQGVGYKGHAHVLRHGFKCYGKTVKVAYQASEWPEPGGGGPLCP